jgi:hypothetical protein
VSDLASAASAASAGSRAPRLLRDRSGAQRVTNIELFFDLVYVFAVIPALALATCAAAVVTAIADPVDARRNLHDEILHSSG